MSYGYGGRNPFDQRDDAPSGGYGAPVGGGYGAPARAPPGGGYGQGPAPYGRNQYGGNTMEMSSMPSGGGGGAQTSVLDECRVIDNELRGLNSRLEDLRRRQGEVLNDASGRVDAKRALDDLSDQIMEQYRELSNRVRALKSRPDARTYSRQVERIDRQVKEAIQSRIQLESAFKNQQRDQTVRQIKTAVPGITESDARQMVDEGAGGQVFTQVMMQSGRQRQANAVLGHLRDRQNEIQKIEQQMTELASLFEQMNQMVQEQGTLVGEIEQQAEEATENLDKGNQEIEVAVNTARSTRKKKWWCLGISVLIVVIIVAGILIWMAVTGKFGNNNNNNGGNNNGANNNKRSMLDELNNLDIALVRSVPSRSSRVMKRIALPAAGQPDTVQDAVAARFDGGGNL